MPGAYWDHSTLLSPDPTKPQTSARSAADEMRLGTACHSRTVLSALPVTRTSPSLLNATFSTDRVSPATGPPSSVPVVTSQSRAVLSVLPEASVVPSGLKATLRT